MSKELHPDHFKMGVFLNLVMVNAHTMAVVRHGPDTQLDLEQARSIAGEAFGIVSSNFLVFDDDKGTLAAAHAKFSELTVEHVTNTLLAG